MVRVRDPGDREAWVAFVALFGPLVYGYGRRKGLCHQAAEDVAPRRLATPRDDATPDAAGVVERAFRRSGPVPALVKTGY